MSTVVAADSDGRRSFVCQLLRAIKSYLLNKLFAVYSSIFNRSCNKTITSESGREESLTKVEDKSDIDETITTEKHLPVNSLTDQTQEGNNVEAITGTLDTKLPIIEGPESQLIDEKFTSEDLLSSVEPEKMNAIGTEKLKKVRSLLSGLVLSDATLEEVCACLRTEIARGLARETNAKATIKCFPTFVQELPNGTEHGRFLALDLGGTNFRVLLIELGETFCMQSRIYAVPHDVMVGPGTGLFDHIASCLAAFVSERSLQDELLPLGFTFSFPCQQEGLTKARLARWTKGFKCAGVEGVDVVELLQEAIARRGDVSIKICAVLNDTTGTLMSCAWKKRDCMIGLIVGTGTNACYMERLERVELFDDEDGESDQVVVNTEWGAFGDNGCLENVRQQCDRNIDEASINKGKQLYEKMISGMYMGEIARQVLVEAVDANLLLEGQNTEALREKGAFFTKYISEVESDPVGDYGSCVCVLDELGVEATDEDCAVVRLVCEAVSRRAASLAGAGVSVLLNRIAEKHVTVAVDGSVYRFHPFFHDMMVETISKLVPKGRGFELMLSEDGSGRGAALVAAVAVRSAMERQLR